jgi:uncharacterized protein YggE
MIRLLVASVTAAALLFSPAAAQPERRPVPVITVTGEAEAALAPDLAILSAGVTTAAKSARDASEANAKAMAAVVAALKSLGVADEDVQTSRLSLQPVRDAKGNELRITGFQATNQVTVKLRDLARTAEVVDRLVGAGANEIAGIQFVVASPSEALQQARAAAIADARRKAETYAKAANVLLGAPVSIIEEGGAMPGPVVMRSARAATPIAPGEQVHRVAVSVSFELRR